MISDEAFTWYRSDRFAAEDLTRATGLSERSQRELLKLGFLMQVPQAKTAQRRLDRLMVKRAAVIAEFNRSGLSLAVSAKIVYAAIMLEDLIFGIIDPVTGVLNHWPADHPGWKWFRAGERATVDADHDYIFKVANSKFVFIRHTTGHYSPIGELTDDLTDFIWWDTAMYDIVQKGVKGGQVTLSAAGSLAGNYTKTFTFQVKTPSEADEAEAQFARDNATTTLVVNASLTLKVALRRLLQVEGSPYA